MTRIEIYNEIIKAFGTNSFDAKMFYKAMKSGDDSRTRIDALYKLIMKKKQGS